MKLDCVVIGAGVIGLAAGRALALAGQEVAVVEAAGATGTGTSSRNSEVIHAGIYYPAGSLKARLCVAGRERLYAYCESRGIRHRRTGKLIVATSAAEAGVLETYREKAAANGVMLEPLSTAAAATLEPAVRCVAALHSPATGILDSHEYLQALQADLEDAGGVVALRSQVVRIERRGQGYAIHVAGGVAPVECRALVNAAGLDAHAVAALVEGLPSSAIPRVRFARGHYYSLNGRSPFAGLVYPVADSAGLGIHVTVDLAGQARFGPDVQWVDTVDYAFDAGNREAFVTAIRRYWPGLDDSRLKPAYTGIRPKLSGPGEPAADFLVSGPDEHGCPGLVNLFGIESPGLTASLALADEVASALD